MINVNFTRLSVESPQKNNKKYSGPNKISFGASIAISEPNNQNSQIIDKLLNNKLAKSLFKIANKNPFAFTIAAMLTACIAMRPATIMLLPGENKEDKKYAAGKSIISSVIANSIRLIFIIPLGMAIHRLGQKAIENPCFKFPKLKTPKFDALKYLITNSAGFVLSLASAALMVKAIGKIMAKLVPENKQQHNQPSQNESLNNDTNFEKTAGGQNGN